MSWTVFLTDLASFTSVMQVSNSKPSGNGIKDVKLKQVFKGTSKLNDQMAQMSAATNPVALPLLP